MTKPVVGKRRGPAAALLALSAAVLLIAGCGTYERITGKEKESAACPVSGVLQDADRLTNFAPGAGRDLTDVQLEARIEDMATACLYDPNTNSFNVDMRVRFIASRGPAATEPTAGFSYFVAIADENDEILAREGFDKVLDFADNRRQLVNVDDLTFNIPRRGETFLSDYRIYVGMQLTPEQLEFNRTTSRR